MIGLVVTWVACLGVTAAVSYAAGARAGYWRGVARGQHAAGQTHMHVMAHTLYGAPLPPIDPDDLDAARKPGAN